MWCKMNPHEVLAEHVVDIHKVMADFRDAFERRQSSSSQTYVDNQYFSSQSLVQSRLSIYNWNPGPRRGKDDAFEKQIAEKLHIVTLQEASDYVDHDILQERFHVTHYAGCAILFNKDTFFPDINVKSIYLHDTRRGEIILLKENMDGFYKAFFHVPRFVVPQSVVRSSLPCCPCISATSTPRRKASPRSSSKLFVPL